MLTFLIIKLFVNNNYTWVNILDIKEIFSVIFWHDKMGIKIVYSSNTSNIALPFVSETNLPACRFFLSKTKQKKPKSIRSFGTGQKAEGCLISTWCFRVQICQTKALTLEQEPSSISSSKWIMIKRVIRHVNIQFSFKMWKDASARNDCT